MRRIISLGIILVILFPVRLDTHSLWRKDTVRREIYFFVCESTHGEQGLCDLLRS